MPGSRLRALGLDGAGRRKLAELLLQPLLLALPRLLLHRPPLYTRGDCLLHRLPHCSRLAAARLVAYWCGVVLSQLVWRQLLHNYLLKDG